ncbi:TPA: hypothetical protein DDW69_01420 [candidate division CPR2 bacterium]|uniref:Uncharacterized protein n=1 Tax=candidate division CPR2 bacterium GW2011_GWC1_41_48 TaxID=1618344 RepID=A0A0G0WCB5_UNCC2|nr:MAG: hypothetical protein UT47_C0001G0087 [candidate division CPR2 bacterium GW2011_GWC2_39_35]KKR27613.1 MAG: hypothetical protein UT60_C0044G0003 [candidate division CPR2 bacterium GW2011_GWD2_39_7]KKR28261.1 MAG: hypothetical protein UT59_C0031G0008 [candidate division CPR2 bacterium GW2011_GWD1_39_7]KKS09682.1 MAG: hypothetical protein UU65_C0001G0087 [candidate division CPR2 bacterium GW2011_GWC1_41_48]OGB60456.1 MAG: hypothetical protein A2Y27_01350 [candidate division CPR2 bacterium G
MVKERGRFDVNPALEGNESQFSKLSHEVLRVENKIKRLETHASMLLKHQKAAADPKIHDELIEKTKEDIRRLMPQLNLLQSEIDRCLSLNPC